MNTDKLTEFITVLICAMVVGALAMLAVLHLSGAALTAALVILMGVTIASWQYLRKRFRRR